MRSPLYALFGLMLLCCHGVAEAAEHDALEKEATRLYRAGEYRRAADLLREVLRKSPGPEVHKALAACYLKLGDLKRAAEQLRELLRLTPDAEDRARAQERLREVEAQLATSPARIESTPPGATVFLGADPKPLGRTPLETRLGIGEQRLRFELEGRKPIEATVVVAAGAPAAVAAAFPEAVAPAPPPAPPPPKPIAAETPVGHIGPALGLAFSLQPIGRYTSSGNFPALSTSGDLSFSYALAPYFDYHASKVIGIGFSPRFTFNEKGATDSSSATEIDLSLRLRFGYPINDRFYPRVLVMPGYALWFPNVGDMWSGFHVAFSGGIDFRVGGNVWFTFDLGYLMSFLSFTQGIISADLHGSYFTIALGAHYAF